MKKMLTLLVAIPLLFISCKKDDRCPYSESGASASTAERTYLANYLAANSLVAVEHTSGVYYNISVPGTGNSPSICSNVTAKYTGSLIPSGNVFDSTPAGSAGISFTLGQLIVGWQKVLPLIKRGGKITLYIPPSLGYGNQDISNQGNVIIPANSHLKFEIELVNVQ